MQPYNIEIKNVLPILTDMTEAVKTFNDSRHIYLNRGYKSDIADSGILTKAFGIKEAKLPEFLIDLGVRSLTLSPPHTNDVLPEWAIDIKENGHRNNRWSELKSEKLIVDLSELFLACSTVAFDDWTNVANSSDLWAGLLSDVIRPLMKKDLDFIFYLGDPAEKLFFQVDEVLDIISEFSKHGRVTFCLDEGEAIKLWRVLNGEHTDSISNTFIPGDLKRKYFSIFKTMAVSQLLIYSANNAMVYSEEQQFVLTRKVVDQKIELAENARDNFVAGFTVGLMLQLDIKYCIALGLIVFGAHGENNSNPGKDDLLTYIEKWIVDLTKEDIISLYQ